jgi:hypothetical protein
VNIASTRKRIQVWARKLRVSDGLDNTTLEVWRLGNELVTYH